MFKVTIKTDNAAFDDDPVPELARLLRELIDDLERGDNQGNICDLYGNKVGQWSLTGGGKS